LIGFGKNFDLLVPQTAQTAFNCFLPVLVVLIISFPEFGVSDLHLRQYIS